MTSLDLPILCWARIYVFFLIKYSDAVYFLIVWQLLLQLLRAFQAEAKSQLRLRKAEKLRISWELFLSLSLSLSHTHTVCVRVSVLLTQPP